MLDRLTHWLKTYGDTGDVSFKDFKEGVSESTFGDVNAIKKRFDHGRHNTRLVSCSNECS
ncbi:hypothetical protein QIU18_07095 [Capnocytophaga canimorsus]|nr:hypothetical protein [Capnocytophaga canimorsus]WGU69369.1 hypothetical protein QIU19_06635 [Capnocytophaga canimorsus]WGU71509.1 hypothetical protein QIU18_07095 [Capnocytophaga canimorsus]